MSFKLFSDVICSSFWTKHVLLFSIGAVIVMFSGHFELTIACKL